jgi:hypothetical protein
VQPHVPTSVSLARLLSEAPQDVSLGWLFGRLQKRSFGFVMLLLALVGLLPGGGNIHRDPPGVPRSPNDPRVMRPPSLPHFLTARRIATRHIAPLVTRTIPLLRRMETLIRPRLHTPFQATKRLVGVVVLILAATLMWPFPFSQVVPALVIMLISFAYLEEDGVLLCISLATALLSFSITAATVWATVSATGVIERLWTGA